MRFRFGQDGSWVSPADLVVGAGLLVWLLLPPNLPVPPQADLVITGVTVINPGIGREIDRTIVIHKGRIAAVGPRRAGDPAPVCPGCFAIPGLIDAHVHTPPWIAIGNQRFFALMYLAYGVTTVRDLGQSDASVRDLADDLNTGRNRRPAHAAMRPGSGRRSAGLAVRLGSHHRRARQGRRRRARNPAGRLHQGLQRSEHTHLRRHRRRSGALRPAGDRSRSAPCRPHAIARFRGAASDGHPISDPAAAASGRRRARRRPAGDERCGDRSGARYRRRKPHQPDADHRQRGTAP